MLPAVKRCLHLCVFSSVRDVSCCELVAAGLPLKPTHPEHNTCMRQGVTGYLKDCYYAVAGLEYIETDIRRQVLG